MQKNYPKGMCIFNFNRSFMKHKLIVENWRKYLLNEVPYHDVGPGEFLKAPTGGGSEEDEEPEYTYNFTDTDAAPRKPDPNAYKKLPIINGINFVLPIPNQGKVDAPYNQKRGSGIHGAIDQIVPVGTECVVVADGEVVEAIDQAEYDRNCAQFMNIMKSQIFGVNGRRAMRGAQNLVLSTQKYANSINYYFSGNLLRRRLKDPNWRQKVFKKLNSVSEDWNGIRAFQDFLTKLGHRNFCAALMRHLLIKGKVNKRMRAGKYIKILTEPDQNGQRWEVSYMHMDSYNFEVGDSVYAGDVIGKAGATGIADDPPHLHFVFRPGRKGFRRDPTLFIPGLGNKYKPQKLNN